METDLSDQYEIPLLVFRKIGQVSGSLQEDDGQGKVEPSSILLDGWGNQINLDADFRLGDP